MKAIEFREDHIARVVDAPEPRPGPDDVIVKVAASGICGSDLTALSGRHPFRIPPLVSGHEAGGVVVDVGARVRDWAVGDRVAIEPQLSCGSCPECERDDAHLCQRKVMLGVAEWPGSFAERVRVPAITLHRVPAEVDDELCALVEPMAVAVHALRQAGPLAGLDVAVLGGGTIGAMVAHRALHTGARSVIVTDPRPGNRAMCAALGAHVFDPNADAWRFDALSLTRTRRFDAVFVATAALGIVDEAIALVRPRGTVVQIGLFGRPETVDVAALQMSEKRLVGSNVYDHSDMRAAIETIAAQPDVIRALITHRGGLEDAARHLTAKVAGTPDDVVKYVVLPAGETRE